MYTLEKKHIQTDERMRKSHNEVNCYPCHYFSLLLIDICATEWEKKILHKISKQMPTGFARSFHHIQVPTKLETRRLKKRVCSTDHEAWRKMIVATANCFFTTFHFRFHGFNWKNLIELSIPLHQFSLFFFTFHTCSKLILNEKKVEQKNPHEFHGRINYRFV